MTFSIFKAIDVDFDATCCDTMFQRIPGENTGVAGGVSDGTATLPAGERRPVVPYFSPLEDFVLTLPAVVVRHTRSEVETFTACKEGVLEIQYVPGGERS